ncbi:MAG: hypothetical protein MJH10_12215 [Epibacterium sp.]|nr:hypothetical protein [Epibacterium sp.]NQX74313.1 hypothetical protein [Epibacterium sp.]
MKYGAILAAIFLAAAPAMAGTLTIRDADTIVVDGTPVRLNRNSAAS